MKLRLIRVVLCIAFTYMPDFSQSGKPWITPAGPRVQTFGLKLCSFCSAQLLCRQKHKLTQEIMFVYPVYSENCRPELILQSFGNTQHLSKQSELNCAMCVHFSPYLFTPNSFHTTLISTQIYFTPRSFQPISFHPKFISHHAHFTPYLFTPNIFHTTLISPQIHFTPRSFQPKFISHHAHFTPNIFHTTLISPHIFSPQIHFTPRSFHTTLISPHL